MSTQKMRIHVTVPEGMDHVLQNLAERESRSLSSKAVDLIGRALELEEDTYLMEMAQERENGVKKNKYLSHEKIWK